MEKIEPKADKAGPKVPPPLEKKVDKRTREFKKQTPPEDITPVSEAVTNEIVDESSDNMDFNTHEEFAATLKPEPVEKDFVKSTETIDLGAKTTSTTEENTVKVDFMDEGFMKDFISKDTERSEEGGPEDKKGEKKEDAKGATTENASDGSSFTKDDFADFADVFMDILDMGISTALRFWAKDTSTTEYELPVDKKRRLVRQLTNLFMKYQTKFSLEFMFVVTLLICYAVPVQKANKRRKLLKSGAPMEEIKRGPGKPRK